MVLQLVAGHEVWCLYVLFCIQLLCMTIVQDKCRKDDTVNGSIFRGVPIFVEGPIHEIAIFYKF